MERQHIFAMIVAVATLNGIFSPYLAVVVLTSPVWLPDWVSSGPGTVLLSASFIASTTTLLFSAAPAGLAERFHPASAEGNLSLWIWLISAVILTLPALPNVAAVMGG
jgi:hypothetical protein